MKRFLLAASLLLLTAGASFAQGRCGNNRYNGNGNGGYGYNNGGYNNGNYGYDRNNRGDRFDERQYVQNSRIYQGLRDGSLNRGEAARLRRELARVEAMEMNFRRNDGRLDMRERSILDRELDQLSASIYRDRRDGWAWR